MRYTLRCVWYLPLLSEAADTLLYLLMGSHELRPSKAALALLPLLC